MATRPSVDPVQRARTQMGYKNNWHRHDVDVSKQLRWEAPLRDERVGIIGGGISGLACAQVQQHSHDQTYIGLVHVTSQCKILCRQV